MNTLIVKIDANMYYKLLVNNRRYAARNRGSIKHHTVEILSNVKKQELGNLINHIPDWVVNAFNTYMANISNHNDFYGVKGSVHSVAHMD